MFRPRAEVAKQKPMEWTEAWVRGQAGWQAFKRGKEMVEEGVVRSLRRRDGIVSGVFSRGKRPIRCVAKEEGGLLAVECGCATNRSTGEICEHGVALALASLTEQAELPVRQAPVEPAAEPGDTADGDVVAMKVRLPERCADMLAAGRLQMRLESSDDPPVPADRSFARFLAANGSGTSGLLQVRDGDLAAALESLAGHPRVSLESGLPVRIADGALDPLALGNSGIDNDVVRLSIAPGRIRVFALGEETAAVVEDPAALLIGRLPVATPSAAWRDRLRELCDTGQLLLQRDCFLTEIEAWLDVFADPAPGWIGKLHFEAATPEHRIHLEGSLNALDAMVEVRYPGGNFDPDPEVAAAGLPRIDGHRVQVRDRGLETAIADRLRRTGWDGGGGRFRLRDPGRIPLWLADELSEMRRQATVVIGERLRHVMERLHVVSPHLDLAEGGSLACELSFQTDDGRRLDPSKIRAILRKGERSTRTRDGAVVVIRREATDVVEPLLADLGLVSGEQQFRITKAQHFLFREYQKKWDKQLTVSEQKELLHAIPEDLIDGNLRPYQQEGVGWLFERLTELSGALLGDEMGLGKTIQTIALSEWLKRSLGRVQVLLLVPTSLLGNWERELSVFAAGLRICRFAGTGRDRLRDEARDAEVLLTSYGTFQRDRAFHLANRYDLAVCDEASLLRNPDSQLSRSVAKLDAGRRLALSGTPVENRLEDLWSIFRFVAPGYLGARDEFAGRYAGDDAGPVARRRLALRISPYYLRRTKEQVAPELPDKLVIDEWLDLSDDARRLYQGVASAGLAQLDAIGSEAAARMHLLTLLLRLRQICLSPGLVDEKEGGESAKVGWVQRLLEERHESGGKTLVFSQFAGFLRDWEGAGGFPVDHVFRLDGSTRDRAGLVERFQGCKGSAVFLISLKAGGYGLNLTAADTVVHMDPWWNPAVENQATDRAHRIGQTRPVTVYRLLARDTVEERVRRIQEQKRSLMEVAETNVTSAAEDSWSPGDLRNLVG